MNQLSETTPLALLESMMEIRALELTAVGLQAEGRMRGTCTSVGQEASAVGVVRALGPDDRILTNHRSAGHLMARGADPGRILAEMMGRSTGYCRGKSGSLHISVKELGVVLTSTIVGGELSLAPGVALAETQLGGRGIVACFFGDGAACEGVFHESLNLASVWDLPILYICENNQWQAAVHRSEAMKTDRVSRWASGYGIEGVTVDGNDVEAVYEAAEWAAGQVRETRRPILLETYTYRLRGHYEPDDQAYVDPAELAYWRERDPIEGLRKKLIDQGTLTPAGFEAIERRVDERIRRAVAFASESPAPELSELLTEVYA